MDTLLGDTAVLTKNGYESDYSKYGNTIKRG